MRTVNLGEPTVGPRELDAVRAVVESGWLSGAGPACRALEGELAALVGAGSALATSNCGSALHLASADPRSHAGRRGHRCRLHLSGHRSRGAMGRCDTGLRRRPPRHLERRSRGRRSPGLVADRGDHRRRRLRAAGRLRRAARSGRRATASGSSRMLPALSARPTRVGPPAALPTLPHSASTGGRASRPEKAEPSSPPKPTLSTALACSTRTAPNPRLPGGRRRLSTPTFSRVRLQLSTFRDPGGDDARPARTAA